MSLDDRIPLPAASPSDTPTVTVTINPTWIPIVLGALEFLEYPTFDGDPVLIENYLSELIAVFAESIP